MKIPAQEVLSFLHGYKVTVHISDAELGLITLVTMTWLVWCSVLQHWLFLLMSVRSVNLHHLAQSE